MICICIMKYDRRASMEIVPIMYVKGDGGINSDLAIYFEYVPSPTPAFYSLTGITVECQLKNLYNPRDLFWCDTADGMSEIHSGSPKTLQNCKHINSNIITKKYITHFCPCKIVWTLAVLSWRSSSYLHQRKRPPKLYEVGTMSNANFIFHFHSFFNLSVFSVLFKLFC